MTIGRGKIITEILKDPEIENTENNVHSSL